ncbi:hypothetical protein [Microvirga calopogonii]|uniref:hypothetical protein n=1 Tax=Microvirga calopogonii TaxID=2078013 RepID=UPI000E0DDD6C|nr:hypothetical protein [Microvirga calopogonii]
MKRTILVGLMVAFGLSPAPYGQDDTKPKQELKCDPNPAPGEAPKKIQYRHNGKTYIEYCSLGKKHVIVDHGQNG